ncbi:MAG: 4Fe-4S dicluster domain-containing protein [Anaerolineae bacterium]|jgi:formate dehydrogenase subunit beta
MEAITENIRREARRLLEEEAVDVVIGYQLGWDGVETVPAFVDQPAEVDKLVYNERCTHNLAKYLVGREGYLTSRFRPSDQAVRVALVALPATLRAVVALLREYQFDRADLTVLGIVDGTPVGLEPDVEVGRIEVDTAKEEQIRAQIDELDGMSLAERREWWRQQFSKCIRCYACRQVCPFCYCEQCIADENQPQWIERSPSLWNNMGWNLIRAYHLTGRCSDCGECDRVCPVGIPLRLINSRMLDEVEAAFAFVPGTDPEAEPALAAFQPDDTAGFIR